VKLPSCPSETALLANSRGELGPAGVERLDGHVDQCETCRRTIALLMRRASRPVANESATVKSMTPRAKVRRPAAPRLAAGMRLADRYHIRRLLGRGGMGEVYEVDDELLNERIALKVLSEDLAADDRANRRLKREVLLARRITHPNVCRLFDMGRHSRFLFLTMELLKGVTLADELRNVGRLPRLEERRVVRHLCAGLQAAHRIGVIHRDFKSENVFLVFDQTATTIDRAVITDFGLARTVEAEQAADENSTTLRGAVLGTMTHASPEQLAGGAVTTASDVYALGVVLYELVTGGALPFSDASPAEAVHLRLRGKVPSPRSRVHDLEPAWEAAILRCLERDPAARFPSVKAVSDALLDS
jgi:serine/threonine protein kinase